MRKSATIMLLAVVLLMVLPAVAARIDRPDLPRENRQSRCNHLDKDMWMGIDWTQVFCLYIQKHNQTLGVNVFP